MKHRTTSVEATRALGATLAASTKPGDFFVLDGELGAGKTEFVRGFVAALGRKSTVHSPSFSILNIYETSHFPIYHFDFYRMSGAAEFDYIGFDDYAAGEGVCLVEWGTLFPEVLPEHAKIIRFFDKGDGVREVDI